MDETQTSNTIAREALAKWQLDASLNCYKTDLDLVHSMAYSFQDNFKDFNKELENFAGRVTCELEPLVNRNNLAENLPQLEAYDAFGNRIDKIIHHPYYHAAGNIIYSSGIVNKLKNPGELAASLSLLFLSSHAGEAGHNCPIACSAGIIRVLQRVPDFKEKKYYLEKLTGTSYDHNYTGAQFLTEIQGGSDVGLNASYAAHEEDNIFRIHGEKWFCSNASADLIFITARFTEKSGTKGLGLFLVPAKWQDKKNAFTIRRLKNKIGTRSMATGEIDFHGAYALAILPPEQGFKMVMDNVLNLSRLFNSFSVLGMGHRAYQIASLYAKNRVAFGETIIHYPLVKQTLAQIKAENIALLSAALLIAKMQDQEDLNSKPRKENKLLLRLLINFLKYFSAKLSVEHIHLALGVLAGNGTIENFSPLPRLLRDAIVCENWEGTHNVLRMQILRDILKYNIDHIFINYMEENLKIISIQDKKQIEAELLVLQNELIVFRKMNHEKQILQIQPIVDRMAATFTALSLLKEALDQQAKYESMSKFDCYQYFCLLHFNKRASNELSLLNKIIPSFKETFNV